MEKEYAPHELRVIEEKKELDEKIFKLSNFLCSKTFLELALEKKSLLNSQFDTMRKYSEILDIRIKDFKNN